MSSSRDGSGAERPKRGKPVKKKRGWLRWLLWSFLLFFMIGLGAAAAAGSYLYRAYEDLPAFQEFDPSLTSSIYDSQGKKVFEMADTENRTLVKLSDVPIQIQNALIATEDFRFYAHFGVDPYRVAGAAWANVRYYLGLPNSQIEGASTLTMQLTRNAFLTMEQTMYRKIQEAMIAVQLERRFTKPEILEKYFNQVAWGMQASGIEAAAQTYFAKPARELTLSEGALLIGMLKATTFYNPFENLEGAMNRRAVVLNQMVKYGYLSQAEADELKQETPDFQRAEVTPTSVTFNGDWYIDHVIAILTDTPPGTAARYGTPVYDPRDLYHKGLQIFTALDPDIQWIADLKVKELMPIATVEFSPDRSKPEPVPQAAVVIMNHKTGEVKAITGGMEHTQMLSYSRATQAYRQPGSAIKPIVSYLPAIDLLGWGPASVIDDSPPLLTHPDRKNVWPENYDYFYSGLQSMRYGLEQSLNAMAVRALEAVTPKKAIEYARKLGLSTIVDASMGPQNDENLALALGGLTTGVTVMDMAQAYGTIGNLGMRVDPVVITKIVNKHGEVVYQAAPRKQQVVRKDSAWLMIDVMKGSLLRGTAYHESKGWHNWPAAGKTGTTEDWHDAWFVGFTPEIVTAIWTGYDNEGGRKSLPQRSGYRWTGAGPPTRIWTAIMNEITKVKPIDWVRPEGIVEVEVCRISAMLPSPLCPRGDIRRDWFRQGFAPTQVDNVYQMVRVVQQPWTNPRDGKIVNRYYLWRDGCAQFENLLMIKRPNSYVKHPTDPWNFGRYWPADWWREVPSELCTIIPRPEPPPTPSAPSPSPPVLLPPILVPPTTPPPVTPPPPSPPGN